MPAKAGITLLLMLLKNGGFRPVIFFEWRFPLGGGNDIFARVATLKIQKRAVGIATGGSLIVGWRRSLFYKFFFCGL